MDIQSKQKLKTFSALSAVLFFGVLLGLALVNIGYISPSERNFTPGEVEVDLAIDYGNEDRQTFPGEKLRAGSTVLDLLENLELKHGIALQKRTFPGLGVFIEGIHGVHNTNTSYWQFWVNGEYSKVGAGQYVLEDGDDVLWKRTNQRE